MRNVKGLVAAGLVASLAGCVDMNGYPTTSYGGYPSYGYNNGYGYNSGYGYGGYNSGYYAPPTYSYQSTTTYYNVTNRVVNGYGGTIHVAPDADSSLVATLPPGAQVTVVGTVNGRWAHVVANGYDGYMDYAEFQ